MRSDTYAVVNLAALNLIEACAVAYNSFDKAQSNRNMFRAEQEIKKIANALGFDLSKRQDANVVSIIREAAE
ncbi:hypothetical protein [Ensifer sp. SL37]|uniref:hypothetical protein n=1 Tax=Ensifer sp. SL37 TaxID=2995137 RepID=UPI0022737539|nr:hypothetical protein [Ensifer sp. SL37]MCY1741191.1 hypothetical protein [Ensifer sp. SL37]